MEKEWVPSPLSVLITSILLDRPPFVISVFASSTHFSKRCLSKCWLVLRWLQGCKILRHGIVISSVISSILRCALHRTVYRRILSTGRSCRLESSAYPYSIQPDTLHAAHSTCMYRSPRHPHVDIHIQRYTQGSSLLSCGRKAPNLQGNEMFAAGFLTSRTCMIDIHGQGSCRPALVPVRGQVS